MENIHSDLALRSGLNWDSGFLNHISLCSLFLVSCCCVHGETKGNEGLKCVFLPRKPGIVQMNDSAVDSKNIFKGVFLGGSDRSKIFHIEMSCTKGWGPAEV